MWDSLLFCAVRGAGAAAAVNSWSSWLWIPKLPSPLLSNPHFWALPNLCFFSFFFYLACKNLDQTHLCTNQEPELSSVQVQVSFLNHSAWKGSNKQLHINIFFFYNFYLRELVSLQKDFSFEFFLTGLNHNYLYWSVITWFLSTASSRALGSPGFSLSVVHHVFYTYGFDLTDRVCLVYIVMVCSLFVMNRWSEIQR